MIRLVRVPVASSVQDVGRFGHRATGHARSGAMDHASMRAANALAGAPGDAAVVELGPGPCVIECADAGTIAFGGAARDGAPWWETIEVQPGRRFELSAPREHVWSYLAIAGGVDAPVVLGSRSTSVREGIGSWLGDGDVVVPAGAGGAPSEIDAPPMDGPVRVFGSLEGAWRVGRRVDRMGYSLEGPSLPGGAASEWSEPMLPGFVQLPPGGAPIVLMAEGPTVGGYAVAATVHSEDLRIVAQTPTGRTLRFVSG